MSQLKCAMIDADGIYRGMEMAARIAAPNRALPDITECDLPPGKYRWDERHGCFTPLPKRDAGALLSEPDAANAIALGFLALAYAGDALHPLTHAWLDRHITSVDFRELIDDPLVIDYRAQRRAG